MKKILLSLTILFIGAVLFAQAPQSFKYQTVVRDAANEILDDQNVYFRISILQYTAGGDDIYVETFGRTTNDFGLVTFNIGEGDVVVEGVFDDIDWSDGPYFVKVEIDIDGAGGTYSYEETGTSKLLSVPYALHSKKAQNLMNTDPVTGDMIYFDGTQWVAVSTGLPGQFLQLQTTNLPAWKGPAFPTLTTTTVTDITNTTATGGGNITDDGGGDIAERGVCWSTDPNPTTSDSRTSDGNGTGTFSSDLSGLTPNTTYYVRAYATNWTTEYGNEVSFKTSGLVLWNKLGSESEVENSEIGENGAIVGTEYAFEPAKYGNGYVRKAIGSNYITFPQTILQNMKSRGTIELWINPKVTNPVAFSYGVFPLLGNTFGTNSHVYIAWGDGETGVGIYGSVNFDGVGHTTAPPYESQYVATIGVPFHIAICWDVDGIDETSNTVRVFRNGELINTSDETWDANDTTHNYDGFTLGMGPDIGGYDKYIVDNIKVWDYAKTDFSDRDQE